VHGPLVMDDMDITIRAAMDGIGHFRSRTTSRRMSRAPPSCGSARIRAPHSPGSFSTTPVDGSSRPHYRLSSKRFACSTNRPRPRRAMATRADDHRCAAGGYTGKARK
jgi:hypothetical protein